MFAYACSLAQYCNSDGKVQLQPDSNTKAYSDRAIPLKTMGGDLKRYQNMLKGGGGGTKRIVG